jgi:hypothetical protein
MGYYIILGNTRVVFKLEIGAFAGKRHLYVAHTHKNIHKQKINIASNDVCLFGNPKRGKLNVAEMLCF